MATTATTRRRTRLKALLRATIAAALLGLVSRQLDLPHLLSQIESFDPTVGLLMFFINLVLFCLFAARWRNLAAHFDIRAPYSRFLRGICLGAFFSQLGPSLLLNEVTRFHCLRSHSDPWPLAMSQLLDRASGQIVLVALIMLLSPYYAVVFAITPGPRFALALVLAIACVGLLIFLSRRARKRVPLDPQRLLRAMNPFESPRHYLCSMAIQLLLMTNFWLALQCFGDGDAALERFLLTPLVFGSLTLLPVSLGDWGTREAAALLFLSATGDSPEAIVAASLVFGTVNLLSTLPCSGLLILDDRAKTHD